jgi:hypothetical protein
MLPNSPHSHSIVNELIILDGLERCCISLDDDYSVGKTALPSDLPSRRFFVPGVVQIDPTTPNESVAYFKRVQSFMTS